MISQFLSEHTLLVAIASLIFVAGLIAVCAMIFGRQIEDRDAMGVRLPGDEEQSLDSHFCPNCGAPLPTTSSEQLTTVR